MKLSMWMIANRLRDLDPVVELDEDAPVTLNSARLAYATNCVYLSSEKEDEVLCKGDGGTLRFSGIDLHTCFEVMQGVFDYFEDWNATVQESIHEERYQDMVDLAWQVLQNPLLLFDGNNRVLGITRQYPSNALDAEWSYISRFGYSSVDAVRQLRRSGYSHERNGIATFENNDNSFVKYSNITVYLNWGDVVCGHLTLLSYDHPFNPGDVQLMETLAGILRPALAQMFFQSEKSSTVDVLLNLLLDKPCGAEQLEARLRYTSWKSDDNYFVAVVTIPGEGHSNDMGLLQIRQILIRYVSNSVVLKNGDDLVIVSTRDIRQDQVAAETLDSLLDSNPVAVGFSMEGRGARSIGVLYTQARYAIRRGREAAPESRFYDFFSVATDFMLEQPLKEAVGAVMPRLGELWEERRDGDELLETLRIYISQNRSAVKTASALYIHRNTVLYRVQKVEETLGLDFHNVYDRHYFLTALHTLELWELRRREEGTE